MKLAEEKKIVPVLASANVGANADFDSINMAGFHHATFIVSCGAFTGDGTFTAFSGATEGAKTTAVPFRHALGGAAIGTAVLGSVASCDVLGAAVAEADGSAAITCTTKMIVIEVDADDMAEGHAWLTLNVAATAGIAHVIAILEPRFTGARSATALK